MVFICVAAASASAPIYHPFVCDAISISLALSLFLSHFAHDPTEIHFVCHTINIIIGNLQKRFLFVVHLGKLNLFYRLATPCPRRNEWFLFEIVSQAAHTRVTLRHTISNPELKTKQKNTNNCKTIVKSNVYASQPTKRVEQTNIYIARRVNITM